MPCGFTCARNGCLEGFYTVKRGKGDFFQQEKGMIWPKDQTDFSPWLRQVKLSFVENKETAFPQPSQHFIPKTRRENCK